MADLRLFLNLDWGFIARDLAKHLSAAADDEAMFRIIDQAKADAADLNAPADFWSRIAAAYTEELGRTGRGGSAEVIARLCRLAEAPTGAVWRRRRHDR